MSTLCFICHSTVNTNTNEDIREKYKEVISINLCSSSQLCYICRHLINKLWSFKSICLKRSMEYPVLFCEKGTINLEKTDTDFQIVCSEELCGQTSIDTYYNFDNSNDRENDDDDNQYIELYDDKHDYCNDTQRNNDTDNYGDVNDKDLVDNNKTNKEVSQESDNFYDYNKNHDNNDNITQDNIDDKVSNNSNDNCNEDISCNDNDKNESTDNLERECLERKKLKKKKKSKRKDFEKIMLTAEEQKAELEGQRKEKKYLEAEFKCYNCALGFLYKDSYQTHMMRHEESNGEYQCAICSLRFANPSVLRSHAASHAERYRCPWCAVVLRIRQKKTHKASCWPDCDVEAASCHLCGRMFRNASYLQQHLKRFHQWKTSNRNYSCSVCGKNFKNQAAVRTHMIVHIRRKFTCDQCQATFSSPYTLNQHKKKHQPGAELHFCEACKTCYNSRKSLLAHMKNTLAHRHSAVERARAPRPARRSARVVPGIKPLCHSCGDSFQNSSKLKRHLREVCEKEKLEEVLSSYYQQNV